MLRHTLAATLLIGAVATPAFAQTRNEVRTEIVEFNRYDLDHDAGADRLIRRIENAADNVCGERMGPGPLDERRARRGCAQAATEDGVRDVAHPNVTGRYYGVTPYVTVEPSK